LYFDNSTETQDNQKNGTTGLSQCHISPSVTFYSSGSLVETSIPRQGREVKTASRSAISGFSARSRRRLQVNLAKIRRDSLPVFVTLTYPAEFPGPKVAKHHLDVFGKALVRCGYGFVWKLEPQKRGAPHFHLLLYGAIPLLKSFRLWVAETWYRIVGSGDTKHLKAGTQVARVRSQHGVRAYAAKYMGKTFTGLGWESPGRFWGVVGAANIPWSVAITVDLPVWMVHRLKRLFRKSTGWDYVSHYGQTFYMDLPEYWLSRLPELCILFV